MGTVDVYTKPRMDAIVDSTLVSAEVDEDGNLIFTKYDETTFNAGHVAGSDATVPDATTEIKGKSELATDSETQAGTDTERVVTPAGLATLTATDIRRGLAELATPSETRAGTDTERVVTPAAMAGLTIGGADLSTTDLDTVLETGQYHAGTGANATSVRHYPLNGVGGLLIVESSTIGTDFIAQTYMTRSPSTPVRVFSRTKYDTNSWSLWSELSNGWERAIPGSISSTGATATLDTTTCVVTVPAGTTKVALDGLMEAGYEYEFQLDLAAAGRFGPARSRASATRRCDRPRKPPLRGRRDCNR